MDRTSFKSEKQIATSPSPHVSGVILAGGQSRRMGCNKAFLELQGKPLIVHVIERIRTVCAQVIIVANQVEAYAHLGARVVSDIYPGKGSLGGMFSGLKAAQTQHALVVACDMPFLNLALLQYLISLSSRADVILPRAIDPSSKFGPTHVPHDRTAPFAQMQDLHPTHAIYAKSCLDPMQNCLLQNNLRMISFFNQVSVQVVEASRVDQFDPQHLSFFNVNTPEDLQIAHSLTG